MDEMPVNAVWTAGNTCFGCGKSNPLGLQISVFRDPQSSMRIVGDFMPKEYMGGFPGILHGGIIYTALDCMASWAGMILRPKRAIWVLRSAEVTYRRPAMLGDRVLLSASMEVEEEGNDASPIRVRGQAKHPDGHLLVEGLYKSVPITLEKFAAATGITDRSSAWCQWVENGAPPC